MIEDALKRLHDAAMRGDCPVIRSAARELAALAATGLQRAAAHRMAMASAKPEICQALRVLADAFTRGRGSEPR